MHTSGHLIRHGEQDHSEGWDPPILKTPKHFSRIDEAGRNILNMNQFEQFLVISSDLKRCMETAELLIVRGLITATVLNKHPIPCPAIAEKDLHALAEDETDYWKHRFAKMGAAAVEAGIPVEVIESPKTGVIAVTHDYVMARAVDIGITPAPTDPEHLFGHLETRPFRIAA